MTLPELVLAQAALRPHAPAVRQWQDVLTYGELAAMAGGLAARLPDVGPERPAGVCLRRKPAMVAGVLGVLVAGGAYVPLDPDGPAARRKQIVEGAGLDVVVVDDDTADRFDGMDVRLVPVEGRPAAPEGPGPALPGNPAYVLHTSGSTGAPKGVVVSHASACAYVRSVIESTGVDERTRALAFASLGFDVSVHDLFVPLAAGGVVMLAGEPDRRDPARLQRFCAEHGITWGCLPVSLLPLLDPDGLPAWRTLVTGAEAPGPEQVERWTAGGRRFLNYYGPTEATVAVTCFEATGRWDRSLPIGRAMGGHRVHLVDEELREVPAGVPGELLIGGPGLARGYLGRAGVTAERFVPDPFCGEPGARLYRTGDLAVLQPDGELLLLGRTDRQIKIRGQRVEIGEVETVLRGHPRVGHAVVEAVDGPAGTRLVAFCTPLGADPQPEVVRAYCAERLPEVMVPGEVLFLPSLPTSASGKVDGAALRALLTGRSIGHGTPPSTPMERDVAEVWSRVLGLEPALEDDFFACGGHSVSAMRLVGGLRAAVGREVTVEDVYTARTLGALAGLLAGAPPVTDDLPVGSPPALTAAQRRLWFLGRLAPDSVAYNIAIAERLHGPLDVPALERALAAVADHHDVLRWRVPDAGGVPHVEVDPPAPVSLDVEDVGESELHERLAAAAAHRFDLAEGPLWRARLFRLGPQDHVLSVAFHHAVFDGWSQRPFLEDLARAYAGEPLPERPARFADYAAWRARRDGRRGKADLSWWTDHLGDAPTVLDLPRDRPRPVVQTYAGALATAALSQATTAAIRDLATRLGTTAPNVLLAAFAELVRRVTGRADIVVGTPAADRRHEAFHDLVGFFVDIVPIRLRAAEGAGLAQRVRDCADAVIDALARPSTTIEDIVDGLALPRNPGRAPLVQVLFNVYNFPEARLRLPGLSSTGIATAPAGSPFDLTVYVVEREGRYAIDIVYNTDLYAAERIEGLLTAYTTLLGAAVAEPGSPVESFTLPGMAALAEGVADEPVASAPAADTGHSAPETETERLLAGIWCDVLDRAEVSATDNFFDVGGTSMAVVMVRDRLAALTGRETTVVELFRYPTVRALAAHLDGASGHPELSRADRRAGARRQLRDKRRRRQ
ncbi:amino acid adenylation domain-containing protein [Nonomuraea maritima]|uniref:Amino acid adenylation domain-containing protein n=1 Tax=Nonomuraea maritima TaxID=683260 RepID=A0A1G9GZV2_9ACTN|nr:non-ribosomal peptide synthetase [Nonomuraea maritima]SDL05793.1 amino acid adenylation domain-containing protein [Nonomuraea maritima]